MLIENIMFYKNLYLSCKSKFNTDFNTKTNSTYLECTKKIKGNNYEDTSGTDDCSELSVLSRLAFIFLLQHRLNISFS